MHVNYKLLVRLPGQAKVYISCDNNDGAVSHTDYLKKYDTQGGGIVIQRGANNGRRAFR